MFGVCDGAFAEYARASQDKVLQKPRNLTFEQAAAVPISATTSKVELVRSLGATDVVDYTREDFATRGVRYDVILDIAGSRALSLFTRQKLRSVLGLVNRADLGVLKRYLEDGAVTPVVDRRYPLSEVPAAVRVLSEGHSRGKAVISV